MPTHTQEEILNAKLAELLTAQEVPANPERRERGKRMDVVADVDGLRVVLEAETGFRRKKQAIKDADARLKQGLTTIVFALCYPDGVTTESLADATLTWTLRTKVGAPAASWSEGGVPQLAHAVRQAPNSLADADKAAQILSDALHAAGAGRSIRGAEDEVDLELAADAARAEAVGLTTLD